MATPPALAQFDRLLKIMARLRGPGGCAWDAAQTAESLKPFLIEETYEVLEAIDKGNPQALCEELGDLLLQVVFHARIASEHGHFNMADVTAGIADKLERRHPQIFAAAPPLDSSEHHHQQWESIKRAEKRAKGIEPELFDDIPLALPIVQRAAKVLTRAERAGHCLPFTDLPPKLWQQRLSTLFDSLANGTNEQQEAALGDLLLAMIARSGPDPDKALRLALERYLMSLPPVTHPAET